MDRSANVKDRPGAGRRAYSSRLRREQAEATRVRILEGLIRTMARGLAEVSVPAVAEEAEVSVKTVYRHFGSKRELIAELGPYVVRKTGLMPEGDFTLDDVPDLVRVIFRRSEAMDETVRAAMASQLGQEMRQQMMPERLDVIRRAIRRSAPDLAERDLEPFSRLMLLLLSSAMLRAFRDYLGAGADDAADDISWATGTLLRGTRAPGVVSAGGAGGRRGTDVGMALHLEAER